MRSYVKWFNAEKGFGFIEYVDGDIFVHYSNIIDQEKGEKNLVNGEYVEFDLVKTKNGYRAKNIKSVS